MAEPVVGIQPKILVWARATAGYSLEEVAQKLKRDPADIADWETGKSAPTYAQLERLAYELYKRPLAIFFFPEPPQEVDVKQEFRTLPDAEMDQLLPNTRYLLRLGHAFQISLKELNEDRNPAEHKIFRDITINSFEQIYQVAQQVREYLGITLEEQSSWNSTDDALKNWRNVVEEAGVFVFKQAFKQKKISGFCLMDAEFPIIFINNSTTKNRQIFTLFHELSHLLTGINAISKIDVSYIDQLSQKEQKIEQLCNALAAEVLVPLTDFSVQTDSVKDFEDDFIQDLAHRYWVSREVILRRLLDAGKIDQSDYTARINQWKSDARSSNDGQSGGNYYATQMTYLGDHYLDLVFSKYYQGKIDVEQVAQCLGIKAKNVTALEAQFSGRSSVA